MAAASLTWLRVRPLTAQGQGQGHEFEDEPSSPGGLLCQPDTSHCALMPQLQQVAGWVWVTALFPGEPQLGFTCKEVTGMTFRNRSKPLLPFPEGLVHLKCKLESTDSASSG